MARASQQRKYEQDKKNTKNNKNNLLTTEKVQKYVDNLIIEKNSIHEVLNDLIINRKLKWALMILNTPKLLDKIDINNINNRGHNAAHLAAVNGYYQLISPLKKAGCKINQQSYYNRKPIHLSVLRYDGNRVILELWKNGVDIDTTNQHGNTALYLLLDHRHLPSTLRFENFITLLSLGANLFAYNNNLQCPFDIILKKTTSA